MEPKDLLPCSQESTTCPYPQPEESSPHLLTLVPKIHPNIILQSMPNSSK